MTHNKTGVLACACSAFVLMAFGIAWPQNLAGFAMCNSVLELVTAELVSLGGIVGTGTCTVNAHIQTQIAVRSMPCLGNLPVRLQGRRSAKCNRSKLVEHVPSYKHSQRTM